MEREVQGVRDGEWRAGSKGWRVKCREYGMESEVQGVWDGE
jgi:hypothetical protein